MEYSFLPTDEYVKVLGRTIMLEDCRVLCLSASGVEFKYTGTKLSVSFIGDSTTEVKDGEAEPFRDQARVGVFVDGICRLNAVITKPKMKFDVWFTEDNTEPGEHIVRIVKLSEPRMSSVGLGTITVTAISKPEPTPYAEKFIEFIGDSITCGYGVDEPDEWHCFSTTSEDATKAYAYLTAQKLGADYSLVSYSGHGLISGYTSNPEVPTLTELVQPYYNIFAYCYNNFKGLQMQSKKWSFDRKPDLIVINLGTNDFSYVGLDEIKKAAFEEDYVDFLEQVHEANPESPILIAFGLMGDDLFETEVSAAETFKEQSGFDKVYSFRIKPQDSAVNGYAADWHPSVASHRIASEALSEFIKTIL